MTLISTYVSRVDDTLPRIAAYWYGPWELYYLIFEHNRDLLGTVAGLVPGMLLDIPAPRTTETTHIIQSGDSVESLALKYYDSEHFAGIISATNGSRVIYESIGEEWTIPALVSQAELDGAERRRAA